MKLTKLTILAFTAFAKI